VWQGLDCRKRESEIQERINTAIQALMDSEQDWAYFAITKEAGFLQQTV